MLFRRMFVFVFGAFAGKILGGSGMKKNAWLVVKNTSHIF